MSEFGRSTGLNGQLLLMPPILVASSAATRVITWVIGHKRLFRSLCSGSNLTSVVSKLSAFEICGRFCIMSCGVSVGVMVALIRAVVLSGGLLHRALAPRLRIDWELEGDGSSVR